MDHNNMKFNRTVCLLFLLAWLFVATQSTPLRERTERDRERTERDRDRDIDREIREVLLSSTDLDDSRFQLQRRCATFNCGIFRKLRLGLGSRNRNRYRYGSHRKIYGNRHARQLQARTINYDKQAKRDD